MTATERTAETIRFTVPGLAPQTTSPNGRASYWLKHRDGKRYGETVFLIAQSAAPSETTKIGDWTYGWRALPFQRAVVTLTQRAVRLRDHDNFAASFKPGLDACVRAGLITDDKPSVIDLVLRAEKVAHRHQEEVVVCIEKR